MTKKALDNGANLKYVKGSYLSVVEKHARDYCEETGAKKLAFGVNDEVCIEMVAIRTRQVIETLGHEPDEIWCAVGSGTLVQGILNGTKTAKIYGVCVGKECTIENRRLTLIKYDKPFEKDSKFKQDFPSSKNYDLKAYEYCVKMSNQNKNVLFWNVL